MEEGTPVEKELADAVRAAVDENPAMVARVIARAMQERGMRCLLVEVGGGLSAPDVQVTLTINDVTAEAVRRVVTPVLRKANVPEEAIPVMAGVAGASVAQWLGKQRARQQAAQQAAAAAGPVAASPVGPTKWSPGRRR